MESVVNTTHNNESDKMNIATHNGTVTVQSPTGNHRTFEIKTQKQDANFAPGKRILSLLTGPNNESDYRGLGFVIDGKVILWKKNRTPHYWSLVKMLLADNIESYESKGVKYYFEGRCIRCNRKLTTPESVESGIGPICAARD